MVEGKSHVAKVIAAATQISRIYKEVCPDDPKEEEWAWMREKDNEFGIKEKFKLAHPLPLLAILADEFMPTAPQFLQELKDKIMECYATISTAAK